MATTTLTVPNGLTGQVQTEFGTYTIAGGQVTVDSRAVKGLLDDGFTGIGVPFIADDSINYAIMSVPGGFGEYQDSRGTQSPVAGKITVLRDDIMSTYALGLTVDSLVYYDPYPFRIWPVSATRAFLIAPHPTLGAIAMDLLYGNGSDKTVPAISLGTPYGAWRIQGFRTLLTVDSDPLTEYTEIIRQDVGSHEFAIQVGGTFGGIFHGGLGSYSEIAPDFTVKQKLAEARFSISARMNWPSGQYALVDETLWFDTDGVFYSSLTMDCPFDVGVCYPDMSIFSTAFTQISLDGGANYTDVQVAADYPAEADTVLLRNPASGMVISVQDNVRKLYGYESKFLRSDSTRRKLYAALNPPNQLPLQKFTATRSMVFASGAPDPFVPITDTFDGSGSLPTGYTRTQTGSGTTTTSDLSGGAWTVAAGATPVSSNRWNRPLTNAVRDGLVSYRIAIDYTATGGTGMVAYLGKDMVGSIAAGNILPFNGAATSLNLNSATPATATMDFTLPADAPQPSLLLAAVDIAGRSISITEVRVTQL